MILPNAFGTEPDESITEPRICVEINDECPGCGCRPHRPHEECSRDCDADDEPATKLQLDMREFDEEPVTATYRRPHDIAVLVRHVSGSEGEW